MKKILFFVLVAMIALFASCKKNYTCSCVFKEDGIAFGVENHHIEEETKKDAREICDEKSYKVVIVGVVKTYECALKD